MPLTGIRMVSPFLPEKAFMKIVTALVLALVLAGCAGAPSRPVFSDFMEVREIREDDALAQKFLDREGETYRLGDPVVTGKQVSRLQIKPNAEESYDLIMTLTGVHEVRWRKFARRGGRQAALVVDGTVCCLFTVADPGPAGTGTLMAVVVPHVAESQEEAEEMEAYFENNRSTKKEQRDE